MIFLYGRKDLGTGILYNMTNGGEGHSNPSPESRRKNSESHKGKTASEETRKKMSESGKGRIFSKEHRIKLIEAKKGKNHHLYGKSLSEETRKKQSDAMIGKKWWNDGCGNCKMMIECPGDGWKLGRKWK